MLLIRLDAIGDALALTPLLAAFRSADIPVDLVLRSGNRDAFSTAAARERYVAPFAMRSNTRANRRAIAEFAERLKPNNYTHTLIATEDPGGYLLARRIGSPHRIGFVNGWGKPFKTLWLRSLLTTALYRTAGLDPSAPHECEVLFELGRTLVDEPAPTRIPARLRPLVVDNVTRRGDRIVVQITDKWERLGIATSDVVKALRLVSALGPVQAISATREAAYADRIEAASGIPVERFNDLPSWKEAIASARVVLAPDSGAIHVAGMVGTPTVAVFPPIALFELQSARWAPWAAPYRIIKATRQWPARAIEGVRELVDAVQSIR